MLSAVFVPALLVAGLLVGAYSSRRKTCRDNLGIIMCATESTALELRLHQGDQVPVDHIVLFMKDGKLPVCPSGAQYLVPPIGFRPTCPVHGDLLKNVPVSAGGEIR